MNPVLVAERQAEIEKVMGRMNAYRLQLIGKLASDDVDVADAERRNKGMPGVLEERWGQFMALSKEQKIAALQEPAFNGMAWQSLLQCSPYLRGRPSS